MISKLLAMPSASPKIVIDEKVLSNKVFRQAVRK